MDSRSSRVDNGVGVSFVVSAVIHMAVFLLLAWWGQLYPSQMAIQETYYVDIVNLPVADPRAGNPAREPGITEAPPPSAPPPPITASKPSLVTPKGITKHAKPTATQSSGETESALNEQFAKLERNAEARREEAVLEKLRSKVKTGRSKVGAQGADGAEAGSRYADYIKSRLEDALKITSSYTSKNPEMTVKLTIAADGRLSRIKIERSSGDATFELAVRRAIDLASEKFTAPPNHSVFENGFVFRPKGISNGTLR